MATTAKHTKEQWQVAGVALYRLNTHGTNRVSALVNVGFDDNGQRMTNAECEQIAANLARYANNFDDLLRVLHKLVVEAGLLADWTRRLDARLVKADGRDPNKEPELGELRRVREAITDAGEIVARATNQP